jgi:hypothetical protein
MAVDEKVEQILTLFHTTIGAEKYQQNSFSLQVQFCIQYYYVGRCWNLSAVFEHRTVAMNLRI